jgi:TPR repeat protein
MLSNDDLYQYAQRLNCASTCTNTSERVSPANDAESDNHRKKKLMVLTIAAERGHVLSCVQLSKMYQNTCDLLFFKWILRAADLGHADSQYDVATYYHDGSGGAPQNTELSMKYCMLAAKQDLVDAQFNLGITFYQDHKYDLALLWLSKAADNKCPDAMYQIGVMYATGSGVVQNIKLAVEWYRRAADLGDTDAQFELGQHYRNLSKSTLEDTATATATANANVVKDAAIANANVVKDATFANANVVKDAAFANANVVKDAAFANANVVKDAAFANANAAENKSLAKYWFTLAANQGCRKSQFQLALHYEELGNNSDDDNDVEKNKRLAFEWCLKSAKLGFVDAQNLLGVWYNTGFYGAQNSEQSKYWFLRAAKQGCAASQYSIGIEYLELKRYGEMMYWLNRSAEQNDADAEFEIGKCFEFGQGVKIDLTIAKSMYTRAAAHGHQQAKDNLTWL